MPRGFSFWTVYACMLSVLFQACANADEAGEKSVPAKETARTDALGDPLPPGAVLRIGTLRRQHQGPVGGIALSPDGKLVASYSSSDGCLRVWSAATGKELRRLGVPNYGGFFHRKNIVFSPDGTLLAASVSIEFQGTPLRLWDVRTGKVVADLEDAAGFGFTFS